MSSKCVPITIAFLLLITAVAFTTPYGGLQTFRAGSEGAPVTLPLRGDADWALAAQGEFSFQLDPNNDLVISRNGSTGVLESSPSFDVYTTLNETAQRAVDLCPQWLNLTLCWKFSELSEAVQYEYAQLLLEPTLNASYLDEMGFVLSYMPKEILTSGSFDPYCLRQDVDVMYNISRELKYADIVDTQKADGEHSTVRYRMPGGNLTLPEDIYYWNIVGPRSNIELPAYINFSLVEATDNPNQYYADHTSGVWWREWLYDTEHHRHMGYPVLSEYLANETVLWKGLRNNVTGNGAVGAVSRWQREVMPQFGAPGNRSHQPVVHYIHHWGMCGENSDMLAAAAKIALIPCVPTLSLEAWHGWNEFWERGWHQWEAYSEAVDYPPNEGGYGATTVFASFNPDSSQRSSARPYTDTSNLTVHVVDKNGLPVDGALVNIASGTSYNNPYNIGLIGNATDARGNAGFELGFGHDYYIHVYSSIGQYPASSGALVKAVSNITKGGCHVFNVTLTGGIATQALIPLYSEEQVFGTRYNISVMDMVQVTKMHSDPFGYGHTVWKDWPNGSRLLVLMMDDENLVNYQTSQPFNVMRVLEVDEGGWAEATVPSDVKVNLVAAGGYQPRSRSLATVNVTVEAFTGVPEAAITHPAGTLYLLGENVYFSGKITPNMPSMGPFIYEWESNISGVLSTSQTFTAQPELGWHNVTFKVSNASGLISSDWTHFRIKHPNRAPSANISLPAEGAEFDYGSYVQFSANGTRDADQDNLSYSWYLPSEDFEIGTQREFKTMLLDGDYMCILTVTDPSGLNDTALVNFTVLPENKPPVPVIESPEANDVFYNDTAILLSAQGTWDEAPLGLDYTWNSSADGVILKGFYGYALLTPGNHTITLWVDDGKHNVSETVNIKIVVRAYELDTPPVAVIASPADEDVYYISDAVSFDPNGSYDPEGRKLTYRWWIDGMMESDERTFSKSFPEGEYTLKLDVFDGRYWVSSAEIVFTVIDRAPVIIVSRNGTVVEEGAVIEVWDTHSLVLNASASHDPDGTQVEFLWSVNGNTLSAFSWVELSLDAGSYAVTLEVSDQTGESSTRTIWLTVKKGNTTVEPPPADDDVVDDDAEEPEPKESGFEYWWLLLLVGGIALALAVLMIIIYLQMKRSGGDEGGFAGEEDEDLVDWEEE